MKGQAIAAETIDAILTMREEGVPVLDIARRTGTSKSTVGRYQLPSESAKVRLLAAVTEHGPLTDLAALTAVAPDIDLHSAIHLLYSLNKAELVTFDERRSGTMRRLSNITAVPRRTNGHNGHADVEYVTLPEPDTSIEVDIAPDGALPEPVTRFPAIRAEMERRALIESAVRSLERAGLDDLALAALQSVDGDPLVTEALDLYRLAIAAGLVRDSAQEEPA